MIIMIHILEFYKFVEQINKNFNIPTFHSVHGYYYEISSQTYEQDKILSTHILFPPKIVIKMT